MINEGRLLSRHGFARINSWVTMVLATLLMVAGAVQLVILLTFGKSGYFGQHTILISTIFSISLGILLIILRQFIKPRQIFQLYENGVLVISKPDNKNKFIPFETINDIYRYRTGKYTRKILNTMAFRESSDKPWYKISPNIAHADRLIEVIKNEQLLIRGPQALNTLAQGGAVGFSYLTESKSKIRRFLRGNFLMMNEKKLQLSARTLDSDDGQHIAIGEVHFISGGSNSQTIKLLDMHGRSLFSVAYTSLFSADLFIALIEHMIQNRIPVRG
ncbi:hypothetical protein BS639_19505 [Rouxiella silvae]|uniref:DUF3137 domain-containing protein n=1 Tax=Rouxiella silvae TaxID=1646373 RepID=A0ABX3TWD8_9GAMM|nr:DUF6585 family protein [Rouxiella silvae]ORJ19554.1 hypothetical protein BS639_19505 [Rouxiella silvae]